MGPPLVREDRGGRTSGDPVVAPAAPPGSHVRKGEPLKASKRETRHKIALPSLTPQGHRKTTCLIGGMSKHGDMCS